MAVYFTADLHFNHAGAINFDNRPFADEEDMKKYYRDNGVPCNTYNAGCMYFGYTPATIDEIIGYWKERWG